MRRFLILLTLLLTGAAPTLSAQVLKAEISRDSVSGVVLPRLINLFGVREWREAVDEGPGVTLTWTVTRWRDRLISDKSTDSTKWTIVIRRKPLLDNYTFTAMRQGEVIVVDKPYPSLDVLAVQELGPDKFHLNFPRPIDRGQYYYTLKVQITSLTDDEASRIDVFQGVEANFMSKIYGLFTKSSTLTAKTGSFRVP